ncbi:peptidoglycan-binding domain-containing protein [Streptomyces montanus]|uniref:peptidoglycan-binding domain-containing protein n=1 Tax=Streptomyces montanus TaxID=2580423 RepID=UPI001FE3A6DE|nr:peptidoglycan-binding domain-containing protein [Streptomyces montanus]
MRLRHALATAALGTALTLGATAAPAQAGDRPAADPAATTYTAASSRSDCVNQVGTRIYRPSSDVATLKIPNVYLRQGSTGACVRYAQELLSSHLGAPGPGFIDGIFGPTTKRYVRTFQGNAGLSVDGVVGPNTWYWLMTIN